MSDHKVPGSNWRQQMLERIPDAVLIGHKRAGLARWCTNRGFHPTLLDLENERARRKKDQR